MRHEINSTRVSFRHFPVYFSRVYRRLLCQYARHPVVIVLRYVPTAVFSTQKCILLIPLFVSSFLPSSLSRNDQSVPVPRFTYFSSLTFTYRALAPTRAKSSHPQPRMLQRRQQRLHLQTGSLKSLLPTRVHSLRLRHKYLYASSV